MFWRLLWILSLLFSLCSLVNAKWLHNVTVSMDGNNSRECLTNSSSPCRTLDYVLHGVLNQNSTMLIIQPGNYRLNSSFTFWYTQQFAIIGASLNSQDVIVNCSLLAGLSFIYSEDITMEHMTLSSCGAVQNSTSRGHPRFLTGLFLVNCIGLTINGVWIKDGPGIGMQLYDVTGTINILNSHFLRNGNKTTKNLTNNITGFVNSGGGIYLEYTYLGGLWPFSQSTDNKYQKNGMFHLFNLTFEENVAPEPNISDSIVVPNASDHVAFGRGGGMSMFVKGSATNNMFWFNRCFFNKNYAVWGGGYFVEFHDETRSNQILFNSCQFYKNTAKFGGGGVRAGLITMETLNHNISIPNVMNFNSCHFRQNKAIFGGAVSLYGTTKASYLTYPVKSLINFTSCLVEDNHATVGSAFGFALWNINNFGIGYGLPPKVFIMNCNITKNQIIFTEDQQVSGSGALYSIGMPISLKSMQFTSNYGTALVLDNAFVQIHGKVLFKNNIGQNGGAAALYGISKFVIAKHALLYFVNNTCHENGGAIYVQTQGPLMVAFKTTELNLHGCFISSEHQGGFFPDEWDFNVTFKGNKGPHDSSGHSVFATTLQFCRQPDDDRINNITLQWKSFNYFFANGSRSKMIYEIVTSPVKMEVNEAEWNVTADKTFSPTLKLIDEKNNSVYGIIDITFTSKSQVTLSPPSAYYLAKDQIQSLKIQGKPFTPYNVTLFTVKSQLVCHSIHNVHIKKCSPGFVPEKSMCTCDVKDIGISRCEDKNQNLFLVKGYWGGYVQSKISEEFVTAPCPYSYCKCSNSKSQPATDGECFFNMSEQCYGNRQGRLCGECKKGFSLKVGVDNCVDDCKPGLKWLGYLVALLLFLSILVLVIMVINFDPFSAYLNAWLYSYQVILLLLPEGLTLDPFLLFIVGLANVRIIGFGGVCMWSNMDDLQKLAFNYLLPVYVIFFLFLLNRLALVCPNNRFTHLLTQKSTARALCTLFVLSYSTVTYISLNILYPAQVGNKYFVFYQGTKHYFDSYHILFAIPAILFLIFVGIVFPLMLIRRQWFSCIDSGLKRLLLDNFQKPFRDDYKWCSGFYFVCRFILLVISTTAPPGAVKVSLQQSACSVILAVFVLCRPYDDDNSGFMSFKILNISDGVLLCNLCVLTSFSGALSGIFGTSSYYNAFKILIYIFGYVPLLYSLCLLVYFVVVKYSKTHVVLEDLG